jgi:tripartite-type tricarboxylate transporter receptor subunit TctC
MFRKLMGALAFCVAGAAGAQAADFPNRAITMIIPWTPGGGTAEQHLRIMAQKAEKILGQPVLLDYKPGANATLGPATMAAMKPDGYTIGQIPITVLRQPALAKVSYDPATDFTYIIHVTGYLLGFMVRTDSGIKNWQEFVAYAKANQGRVSYAHSGTGGTPHLGTEIISEFFGFKMTPVPFRGQGEMTAALLGSHVQASTMSPGAKPQVESGDFRILMVWTPERSPTFPDAPTLKELGMDRTFASPYGLAGPKGIDPKIVKILHDALKEGFDSKEHMDLLKQLDQPPLYMNSADYTAFALKTIKEEKAMVEKLGISIKQ